MKFNNPLNQKIHDAVKLLNEVQEGWKEEDLVEYPEELPSFDEFVCAIAHIYFKEPKENEGEGDALVLLERMKFEHTTGTGEPLPAMKLYFSSFLTAEAFERLEDKLRDFLCHEGLCGVIEDEHTGNTTRFGKGEINGE